MTSVIYAVGDVHGRDDLLSELHESIKVHHGFFHSGQLGTILHIGDYIDRGGNSAGVIDRIMRGVEGFDVISLMGNHEAMMLECLETDDPDIWSTWLQNGGLATLGSLGVSFGSGGNDPELLRAGLGEDRIAWLQSLLSYYQTNRYLFVHAGIVPGVAIESQDAHDLMWIRGPFLDSDADHGRLVVHGHTPYKEVDMKSNRLNIDTGVVHYGRLTAVVLTEDDAPKFLYAVGEPGKGPIIVRR